MNIPYSAHLKSVSKADAPQFYANRTHCSVSSIVSNGLSQELPV